jgi:DNA-binding LytR/AlgR family response regulator
MPEHNNSIPAIQATAVIAEDEAPLREQLCEQLMQVWPGLLILEAVSDGVQALRALAEHQPQLLFLDIEMPGATGIEVARQASGRCHVVFVTAYDQYAVSAFEQGAVDYIMKPFNAARLFTATSRLKARLQQPPAKLDGLLQQLSQPAGDAKPYLRWINASQGQNIKLITVEEICYFKADSKYTLVVTHEGESLIRTSIKELTEQLDPNMFWQIHRSTIINVHAVAGVTRNISGNLVAKLKQRPETLAISESNAHLFRQM